MRAWLQRLARWLKDEPRDGLLGLVIVACSASIVAHEVGAATRPRPPRCTQTTLTDGTLVIVCHPKETNQP